MVLQKLTIEIVDKFIYEFKKNENQNKLKIYVIDPIIYYILDRLYPYIFITSIIFILILILIIMILVIILKK
jgi:uncharacterized membrane protein